MRELDSQQIDAVFRQFDRPVWIVTAAAGSRRGGLLATWVYQASIDRENPRLLAGIAPNHHTHELIAESGAFAAQLISPQQIEIAWTFALGSGRDKDKLAGVKYQAGRTGSPLLEECVCRLECRVVHGFDAGDRTFFLASILCGESRGDAPPLTEQQLLAAATAEQMGQLRQEMQQDIETQRSLWQHWAERLTTQDDTK